MSARIVLLLISLLLVTGARAYPPDDARNYRNTAFIRAHFEIVSSIRHLKADLEFIPSCDAKTALLADFQALQSDPDIEWWEMPDEEEYTKILQDEKALDSLLKFKPVTRKKFHRDEKTLDAAYKVFWELTSSRNPILVVVPLPQPAFICWEAPRFPATPEACEM